MLNIFYQPDYTKRKREVFTFKLKESKLLNKLIDISYKFNFAIPNRYISNGPHKAMNNLIKTFKNDNNIVFNKLTYNFSYIIQFDWFGERILKKIITNTNQKKSVLIGPLYTDQQLKKLVDYTKSYNFIKIVAASKNAVDYINENFDYKVDREKFVIIPTGVVSEKSLLKLPSKKRNKKCLIYFKNRKISELNKIKNLLNMRNIEFDIFEYGKYDNQKLIKAAKSSKFCIVLNSSESQGLAIQELMACNIPMFIWDTPLAKSKKYFSSVPYFDERCGIVVSNFHEFSNNFENFLNNLNFYEPKKLILEQLTFDKFKENLFFHFRNF